MGHQPASGASTLDASTLDAVLGGLFAQSPLSTVVYDPAGHVVVANAAFERLFGLRIEDLPRSYSIRTDPQLDAQGVRGDIERAFAGEHVVLPPVRYSAAPALGVTTTTWTQAQLYPLRDAHGAVHHVVLVHIDLTARLEAETALREGEARSRLLADAGVALAASLDLEQTVDAVCRLAVPALADACHVDLLATDGTSGAPASAEAPDARTLCVPLVARGTMLGTLRLVVHESRPFADEDMPVVTAFAQRAAVAIDNARLHHTALEASRASERAVLDLEVILGSISDPFVVYDAAWRFQYINGAARDVFRAMPPALPQDALLHAPVWDAYPFLHGTSLERAMRSAAASRVAETFEEFATGNGTWVEVRCYPMPGDGLAVTWRDISARKRAEEAEHFIAEATGILASSLDHAETLASLARLVVPQLADWCTVDLLAGDGSIERVALAHVDPARIAWAREFNARYPVRADDASGVAQVIRSGLPERTPVVTDEMLVAGIEDVEYRALVRELRLRSVLIVPLIARGRTIGALSLVTTDNGRSYDAQDERLALELARRAAMAVDNARLHEATVDAERAAAAHAQDVERFRRAQAAAPDAFAMFDVVRDAEGRVVDFVWDWANAAALRVQQTTLDVIRGQRMLVRNPGIAELPLFAGYVHAVETGEPYEVELPYQHEWIDTWFRITAVPAGSGLAVTFADVTAQKRATIRTMALYEFTRALAVATSREELGAVVLERVMPLLGTQAASLIEYEAATNELVLIAERGFDPDALREWTRYPLSAGTPGADAIRSGETITIATREEWVARYPQHLQWADRSTVVGSALVPLRLGDRVLGIVTLHATGPRHFDEDEREFLRAFADQCAQALERVRLFEAERRMREEAETANRSKTEFLASMSHELRTPLNAIGGYAELLLLGIRGAITPEQQQDLERINRSQRHLLSVINDILNFARLEAGFVDYALQPVRMDALFADVVPLVLPQLEAKSLTFAQAMDDGALTATADPEKVRQILLNLLANAIKFTPTGGAVSMTARADDGHVVIAVRDTGIGIPGDRLGAVFEPFVQLGRSLTRPVEGTGLGLAISRDLARGMHGELVVQSEPGSGSTFTVRLPIAPHAPDAPIAPTR